MKLGVVMPVGAGRSQNVIRALDSLEKQDHKPVGAVLVHDGKEAMEGKFEGTSFPLLQVVQPKHIPGREQPRNVGVRFLEDHFDVDHVWFVDSDLIFCQGALGAFQAAYHMVAEPRILVGPYEWLSPGQHEADEDLHNDPRWVSFSQYSPEHILREDIGAGLACFSGNLVWPIELFKGVGGFWNEIHHGRCEDGELGLRATALGVPISFVREARAWHLWHAINNALAIERNARDVPMLNARHPWVQGEGLAVVPQDGRRFDARCPNCNEMINTIEMWSHTATCGKEPEPGTIIPTPMV